MDGHDVPTPPPGWAPVLELAREHSAALRVSDLADQAGYSPFHFSRLFTARFGIGPGHYLTALRIHEAKRLLLTEDHPVIDVATACGFDSLSSFSRRFRASVGVPPGGLRRLADRIADRPPRPFALVDAHEHSVRVHLDLPAGHSPRGDASVWVGWYAHPAPIGLPGAGLLCSGTACVDVPLHPGAPYLLGFAVAAGADPLDQLLPSRPLVSAHRAPLTGPAEVTLGFTEAGGDGQVPLLSALPVLYRA